MCGIVGAISNIPITEYLTEGLQRLEYRGYDSAGLAFLDANSTLHKIRRLGKVKNLAAAVNENPIPAKIGIAHTRWATHGAPSESNAHPHQSEHICIVHNGIIENYEQLRAQLIECGYIFTSETDSEVIAHLIHWEEKKAQDCLNATQNAIQQLTGAFSILVLDQKHPDTLIAARQGSPLLIGFGDNQQLIASDHFAIQHLAEDFIYLEDGDIAKITLKSIDIFSVDGKPIQRETVKYENDASIATKGDYDHFMQKEIYFQPEAIKHLLKGALNKNNIDLSAISTLDISLLQKVQHVQIVACGTSYNAGLVAKYWFATHAKVSCDVDIASEFRYRDTITPPNTLFITLSQSGETADTLAALKNSKKEKNYLARLCVCNVPSSSMVRESDYSLFTKAGIEIGVASTKAFTAQLTALLLLITQLGKTKQTISETTFSEMLSTISELPKHLETALTFDKKIQRMANPLAAQPHLFFLGRGEYFPISIEAALKFKEITYICAESFAAGELKHGPLALIEKDFPVVVISPTNALSDKMKSNIEEVKARGGEINLFTDDHADVEDNSHTLKLPKVPELIAPIYFSIPMQLLAYFAAVKKGTEIDQPKNLAKSVTVE